MPISIDKFPVYRYRYWLFISQVSSTTACDDDIAARQKLLTTVDSVSCRGRGVQQPWTKKKPVPSVFGDFFPVDSGKNAFFKADLSFRLKIYLTRTHVKGGDSMPSSVESRVRGAR